jgi:putative addiction module component (TIGR02574 family)
MTPAQQRELDARLQMYRVDRDRGEPATEVIERIRARL